jgi:hypothetical protein
MIYVILAIVVIAVVVAAVLLMRQRQSQQLQKGFGPEYDRTVEERGGDQRAAEAELRERRERRGQFEVRDLDPDSRDRYVERWRGAQRRFVDEPAPAVGEADALVIEVMRERGYPVADEFEQRAADVSVDHPEVVEHYRAAHGISSKATAGDASTEDLRQAMVHFRALFAELLGYEGVEAGEAHRDDRDDRDDRADGTESRTDRTSQDPNVRR